MNHKKSVTRQPVRSNHFFSFPLQCGSCYPRRPRTIIFPQYGHGFTTRNRTDHVRAGMARARARSRIFWARFLPTLFCRYHCFHSLTSSANNTKFIDKPQLRLIRCTVLSSLTFINTIYRASCKSTKSRHAGGNRYPEVPEFTGFRLACPSGYSPE